MINDPNGGERLSAEYGSGAGHAKHPTEFAI